MRLSTPGTKQLNYEGPILERRNNMFSMEAMTSKETAWELSDLGIWGHSDVTIWNPKQAAYSTGACEFLNSCMVQM